MAGAGAAVGFGGVAPVGALLHPLHHQAQQGGDRPLHVNARHSTRLKIGDAEKMKKEELSVKRTNPQIQIQRFISTGLEEFKGIFLIILSNTPIIHVDSPFNITPLTTFSMSSHREGDQIAISNLKNPLRRDQEGKAENMQ